MERERGREREREWRVWCSWVDARAGCVGGSDTTQREEKGEKIMRSVKVVQGRPSLWCAVKLRATLGVRGSTEETTDNGTILSLATKRTWFNYSTH